jgi:phosphohistidine phosphatase
MEIYILRHAEAEEQEVGRSDQDRKLTLKGKRDTRAVAKAALRARETPQIIFTSPLRRAQETAAIAAGVLGCLRVKETMALKPDALPEDIWRELCAQPGVEVAMVVGHEPHLGLLVQYLLEARIRVKVKKASLIKITAGGRQGSPRGQLDWMIAPRLIRRS